MITSWIVATVVCFGAVLLLKPAAVSWGLVDTPCSRKKHIGQIPLVGGLAIYIAMLTTISIYVPNNQHINLLLVAVSLVVFMGALDDKYDISAKLRLIAQILVASILTFGTGIQIESLGNVFGFGEILTGPFSGAITVLALVAGINAFNMTDGIDGLAGSLSLVSLVALSILLNDTNLTQLVLITSATIIVFLFFNLGLFTKKHKVFMGDAGSMMLGLVITWLFIVASQDDSVSVAPINVIWFIAVPVIDMLTVMYRRMKKGRSPLSADRDHLHHSFIDLGFNSKQSLCFILFISLFFSIAGFAFIEHAIDEYVSLICLALAFLIYNRLLTLRHKIKKKIELKI